MAKIDPFQTYRAGCAPPHGSSSRIPSQGEVLWKLESGSFSYYRWEILDVEHNPEGPYREGGARAPAELGTSASFPSDHL
ncbi:hypothetical protein [Sorangium sp. So ce381]|uniref:hypothetical protein n=1 Tax=Sorangium sp. So ce381 TaxID=3133307 RepID=UPI003F5C9876